ncbi:MAG TPA: phosphodiester glycosidase family protein [Anaerolineae bacterium]|nr:phosphodiester glycosidase family protein [Anaerolineae bacterium]
MAIQPTSQTPKPRRKRKWLWLILGISLVGLMLCGGLVVIPVISPATGAALADDLRAIFGPEFVAQLESVSFRIQDTVNRARYQASGGQAQLNWDQNTVTTTLQIKRPTKAAPITVMNTTVPKPGNAATLQPAPLTSAQSDFTVVTALSPSNLQWQPYGPSVNGEPIMARSFVQPDPERPYAQAAVVRIDLSQIQLHLMPGTVEPVASKAIPGFKRPGTIPAADQNPDLLLAAFNGGFKAVHGHYGMMVDGKTLITPTDGLATIALQNDGTIQIGEWGRDITSAENLVWYRQNCPLLVDEGQINPHVDDENRKEWGYTVKNLDTTWRSGLGITQDGQYLIYAAGNSLTVRSLAQALQQAGAYYAMQTDINGFYTRFVTYQPSSNSKATYPLVADKLLKEMSGDPELFLHPYDRDFFYVTLKP